MLGMEGVQNIKGVHCTGAHANPHSLSPFWSFSANLDWAASRKKIGDSSPSMSPWGVEG